MPRRLLSSTGSSSVASSLRRPRFRPCLDLLEDRVTPVSFGFALDLGSALSDYGRSVATDAAGNCYVAGYFEDSVDFDPGPGTATLTSAYMNDVFVAKYSAAGALVWAGSMGGLGAAEAFGITLDAAGNVYVTGEFNGTADFDPGAGTFNLTSAGSSDAFVAKLDSGGNFVWARALSGANLVSGQDIAVDAAGNVYTTGRFWFTADFDPGVGTFNLTSAGSDEAFVSKLDSAGNFLWAGRMGGSMTDQSYAIALDAAANVYIAGNFGGTSDFDPGAGTFNLTSAGVNDVFVAKLDTAGSFQWARRMGGSSIDLAYGLAVDAAGNVTTTGTFNFTVDFDPGVGSFNLTSAGSYDIFVSRLDSAGNFVWAKSMGGAGNDQGFAIALDAAGNVFTTGHYSVTADFDPGVGTFTLISVSVEDIFVSKLDSAGNFVWASSLGGTFVDDGIGIAVDAAGTAVYTTGLFTGTADFDPGAAAFNLTAAGSSDIFVSKLLQFGVTIVESAGSTNVTEGGATDTYTVVLTQAPTANVLITLTPNAQVTTAPTILTFTPANWNIAQTVTVTAVDDALIEGNHTGVTSFTTSSADTNHNALAVPSLTANITDNDAVAAGVTITESAASTDVAEGGATDPYTVVLNTAPTANVTIGMSVSSQYTTAPASLIFTPANWNIAQTVIVTAVDDTIFEGPHTAVISHTAVSTDVAYDAIAVATLTANIADNDSLVNSVSVIGTPNPNKIVVTNSTDFTIINVSLNGKTTSYPSSTSQLLINTSGGNDDIQIYNPMIPIVVTGGQNTDKVRIAGAKTANAFTVASGFLTVNGVTVTLFEVEAVIAAGNIAADNFTIQDSLSFTAELRGDQGSDLLIASDRPNTWQVNNPNSGSLNGAIKFTAVENLTGGASTDGFFFSAGRSISGSIDGGTGANMLDYSLFTSAIAVNLQTAAATGMTTFQNIGQIVGGKSLNDRLVGLDQANTWNITDWNKGSVNGVSFQNIENLFGGQLDDTFLLADNRGLKGKIDGGGSSNTLDYASYLSRAVVINLQSHLATNLGGFVNLQRFQGGSAMDTLTGANQRNAWNLTSSNAGAVSGLSFAGFENLTGGIQTDTFSLSPGADWTGLLQGGSGTDTLNAFPGSVYTTTTGGAGLLNGRKFQSIEYRR